MDIDSDTTIKAQRGKALLVAAEAKDWAEVQRLVAAGADVNFASDDGTTALWLAVVSGQEDVVTTLVDAGADINEVVEESDQTPLAMAADVGHWSVVLALVRSNRLEDVEAVNKRGRSVLWLAVKCDREDVVKALIDAGADVNKADEDGTAPLSVAQTLAIATALLEHGAHVDAVNNHDESALWLAVECDREDIVNALIDAGADVNKVAEDGTAPLSVAQTLAIATALLERGAHVDAVNERGESALWLAVECDREDIVKALIDAGADVNKVAEDGTAPLSVAQTLAIAIALLERGAHVDAVNERGESALWLAVESDSEEVVKALVEKGADVNKAAEDGTAPLSVARTLAIATALLERGAHVDAVNKRGKSALWLAVECDREDIVKALIDAGADVNKVAEDGTAPLSVAQTLAIAIALREHGAHVDAVNKQGKSALWLAVQRGNEDVANELVEKGADVNKADVNGVAPLSVAWTVAIATALLEHGAHVDAVNKRGESALWLAVVRDRENVVKALVDAGADVNKADENGTPPLSGARTVAIVTSLLEHGAHVDAVNERGESALWLAVQRGQWGGNVAVALVKAGATNKAASNGVTPLVMAVDGRHWCTAIAMLASGSRLENVDAVNVRGESALWLAVERDREDVVKALVESGADVNKADVDGTVPLSVARTLAIASALVEHGAHVDAVNKRGDSALLLASERGRDHVVKALVEKGADVNKAAEDGTAPLSVARTLAIATALLERGAHVDAVNKRGESALWLAVVRDRENVVKALVDAGADVNKADENGTPPLIVARTGAIATALLEHGAHVDAVNKRGESALWLAAQRDSEAVFKALVDAGADVNKADENGTPPLSVSRTVAIVTSLLEHGAHVDAVNVRGESALWLAVERGRKDVVKALIETGADLEAPNNRGLTPLHLACSLWNEERPVLLIAAGANVHARDVDGSTPCHSLLHPGEHFYGAKLSIFNALLAAGCDLDAADHTGVSPRQILARRGVIAVAENAAEIEAVRRRIAKTRLDLIRDRAVQVCIGLHSLRIDALQMCEILQQACFGGRLAQVIPFHIWWKIATTVKHFR